jgi:hypothetical protein
MLADVGAGCAKNLRDARSIVQGHRLARGVTARGRLR